MLGHLDVAEIQEALDALLDLSSDRFTPRQILAVGTLRLNAQYLLSLIQECWECHGAGTLSESVSYSQHRRLVVQNPCPVCKGSGVALNQRRLSAAFKAGYGFHSDSEAAVRAFLAGGTGEGS